MANSIIPATPSLTGVTSTAVSLLTTSTLTVYVASTTSPYSIDMSKLIVQFQANTSVASSIEYMAGDNFSETGQALPTALTIPSACTVITIGGTSFESARFQQSDGSVTFYNTGGTVLVTAFLLP
jgi:hypothetical protein